MAGVPGALCSSAAARAIAPKPLGGPVCQAPTWWGPGRYLPGAWQGVSSGAKGRLWQGPAACGPGPGGRWVAQGRSRDQPRRCAARTGARSAMGKGSPGSGAAPAVPPHPDLPEALPPPGAPQRPLTGRAFPASTRGALRDAQLPSGSGLFAQRWWSLAAPSTPRLAGGTQGCSPLDRGGVAVQWWGGWAGAEQGGPGGVESGRWGGPGTGRPLGLSGLGRRSRALRCSPSLGMWVLGPPPRSPAAQRAPPSPAGGRRGSQPAGGTAGQSGGLRASGHLRWRVRVSLLPGGWHSGKEPTGTAGSPAIYLGTGV